MAQELTRTPQNLDAERALLGGILLDPEALHEAVSVARAEDFAIDSHRRMFAAMQALSEAGHPVDMVTLAEELTQREELKRIGGAAYLASLTDGLPRRPSVEHYARMVRDKAVLRRVMHICEVAGGRAQEQRDPATQVVADAVSALLDLADGRTDRAPATLEQIVTEDFGTLDAMLGPGGHVTGTATHYVDFDQMTSGLQPQDLVVLAGRPSMGKTALAVNIAENVTVEGKGVVAVFSLEMSRQALLQRVLCSRAHVDLHKLRAGFLGRADLEKLIKAYGELAEAKLLIDDTAGISLAELRAKALRVRQSQGRLDLVIVDYLQLMTAPRHGGRGYGNRTEEVSAISRGLKAVAKELRCPVLALSQLSRAPEARKGTDHRPVLSDLRESGSIEQDADVVGFVYREEVYKPDDPDLDGRAELIVAKQRNGPTGVVHLAFLKRFTRFESMAQEEQR